MSLRIVAPALAAAFVIVSAVVPATAAAPAPTPVPAPMPAATPAAPAKPAAKTPAKPAAAAKAAPAKVVPAKVVPGDLNGTWSGALVQVGRGKGTAFVVTLKGKTGETSYPEQNCAGKLTRSGNSGDYSFFTETIAQGRFDAATGKGCVDGSLTLIRSNGALVAGWIGTYGGKAIVAYGTLAPKP